MIQLFYTEKFNSIDGASKSLNRLQNHFFITYSKLATLVIYIDPLYTKKQKPYSNIKLLQ